jgi:hypothetical protein
MALMELITLTANGAGTVLACTDSSGDTRVALVGEGDSIVVSNTGDKIGFLAIGSATGFTATAPPGSTASYPIFPLSKEDSIVIDKSDPYYAEPFVAGVCLSGETTTLIVHRVSR